MNNFYNLAADHAVTAIILVLILAAAIVGFTQRVVWVINRAFRSANIRKHGWPPSYCDADGDFMPIRPISSDTETVE